MLAGNSKDKLESKEIHEACLTLTKSNLQKFNDNKTKFIKLFFSISDSKLSKLVPDISAGLISKIQGWSVCLENGVDVKSSAENFMDFSIILHGISLNDSFNKKNLKHLCQKAIEELQQKHICLKEIISINNGEKRSVLIGKPYFFESKKEDLQKFDMVVLARINLSRKSYSMMKCHSIQEIEAADSYPSLSEISNYKFIEFNFTRLPSSNNVSPNAALQIITSLFTAISSKHSLFVHVVEVNGHVIDSDNFNIKLIGVAFTEVESSHFFLNLFTKILSKLNLNMEFIVSNIGTRRPRYGRDLDISQDGIVTVTSEKWPTEFTDTNQIDLGPKTKFPESGTNTERLEGKLHKGPISTPVFNLKCTDAKDSPSFGITQDADLIRTPSELTKKIILEFKRSHGRKSGRIPTIDAMDALILILKEWPLCKEKQIKIETVVEDLTNPSFTISLCGVSISPDDKESIKKLRLIVLDTLYKAKVGPNYVQDEFIMKKVLLDQNGVGEIVTINKPLNTSDNPISAVSSVNPTKTLVM